MKKMITANRKLAIASAAALIAILCALAVAVAGNLGQTVTLVDPPAMTLTYEVYGTGATVGHRTIPRFKEIRTLEYRGKNDWRETVITSPELDLGRYGTGTNVGSYYEVRGNTITEYDSLIGFTSSDTRDGSSTEIPNGAFAFTSTPVESPLGPDVTGTGVTTDAQVCINGNCSDNASGVKFSNNGIEVIVLSGVDYTIPMKYGDYFLLKSAVINDQ